MAGKVSGSKHDANRPNRMEKQIFIGSSGEARTEAERIAGILEQLPDVKPRLWYNEFSAGDITVLKISALSREVAGALILATPDDDSVVRGQAVKVPRPNVVFEYGYLTCSLGLSRVAMCRYDTTCLPSDLEGVTFIQMGPWGKDQIDSRTSLTIKKWAKSLSTSVVGGLQKDIDWYETRLKELRQTYQEAVDGKVEQSRRNISFQLDLVEEKLKRTSAEGRFGEVWILGTNAAGPLHHGREVLIQLLLEGGCLRLLLLDPDSPAFKERCDCECDCVGRIAAELRASFLTLLDILQQQRTRSPNNGPGPRVEVRLHRQQADRSLIIVDAGRDDGIVLENPYPEERGKRGVEGRMYTQVKRGPTARGYIEDVKYFNSLWQSASVVEPRPSPGLEGVDWPYTKPEPVPKAEGL
jgi:hypothetical protein